MSEDFIEERVGDHADGPEGDADAEDGTSREAALEWREGKEHPEGLRGAGYDDED